MERTSQQHASWRIRKRPSRVTKAQLKLVL